MNQFAIGEPNFNAIAVWVVFLPVMVSVLAYLPTSLASINDEAAEHPEENSSLAKLKIESTSYLFGWGGSTNADHLITIGFHFLLLSVSVKSFAARRDGVRDACPVIQLLCSVGCLYLIATMKRRILSFLPSTQTMSRTMAIISLRVLVAL
jgi:hypothetical protein